MPYVPLNRFLFRAPLLSTASLLQASDGTAHPTARLLASDVGREAIALASPDLAEALGADGDPTSRQTQASVGRYARRAAFRATPSGWFAGIGIGTLAADLEIRTGEPRAHARPSWGRVAALGRALLAIPAIRQHTHVRLAPSVLASEDVVLWLGPGESGGFVKETRSAIDNVVGTILDVAEQWTPWADVRAALLRVLAPEAEEEDEGNDHASDGDNTWAESIDDVLLTMLDDAFLHSDLCPPLIGPTAADWMHHRLSRLLADGEQSVPNGDPNRLPDNIRVELVEVQSRLVDAREHAAAGRTPEAKTILLGLPGDGPTVERSDVDRRDAGRPLEATLCFDRDSQFTLPRPIVERAAALAPILFRLQEALASPVAERTPGPALADALDATTEIFGAGAYDLRDLATGAFGVVTGQAPSDADSPEDLPETASAPPGLVTFLMDKVLEAVRDQRIDIALDVDDLAEHLPPAMNAPPSCELFLTPTTDKNARAPGSKTASASGWLLGLHAPAGASWGRFAHALSAETRGALFDPLVAAELDARPGEISLDVAFAPDGALADLCAHPPMRQGALALSHWPEGYADDDSILSPVDFQLVAEPADPEPLALRHGTLPLSPSPLHRVRSTTAPPGMWRLLTGWRLCRQHRPWAMSWGSLGALEFLPRVSLAGFVIAPASWRIPDGLKATPSTKADSGAIRRQLQDWRDRFALPRFVQVGNEDELLPVDLDASDALADLRGQDRIFEIWPPLDESPDEGGRRVEAVIALVNQPTADERAVLQSTFARVANAGSVAPPHRNALADVDGDWTTFKIFGLAETQDAILTDVVEPAIEATRDAGKLSGWFFQRYVDPPGHRAHLRVRVNGDARAFAAHLETCLEQTQARARGHVVAVEQAPYFAEAARYGGVERLPLVHRLFELESALICACLAAPNSEGPSDEADGTDAGSDERLFHLVTAFDVLARALGVPPAERQALAARRRRAHSAHVDEALANEWAGAFRDAKPHLRARLSRPAPGAASVRSAFERYEQSVAALVVNLDAETLSRLLPVLLPPLLHVNAVRWMGANRLAEIQAYTYWERTRESLGHHRADR